MNQLANHTASSEVSRYLQEEYQQWESLFAAQPAIIQQYLQGQARQLGDALLQAATQVRFTLPDRVLLDIRDGLGHMGVVPSDQREQMAGGLLNRLTRTDIRAAVRQRLNELDAAADKAIAISAGLIRHATVSYLVNNLLPAGRSVTYRTAKGEEIPTLPQAHTLEPASAITATTDAIAEEEPAEEGRGELLVPYVPAARRFYLPQWVAFDDAGKLLVNTVGEAEAYLASMQRFMTILHTAVALAPYMVASETYQQKRYGMLGQLINQGRALARYQTSDIIHTIQQRAHTHELNRGLSLSLPYFDDQLLEMRLHNFEVVPAGRIMFVPAFVVRASRQEQAQVAQDTRLSFSTRKYLLAQLKMLEEAFVAGGTRRNSGEL